MRLSTRSRALLVAVAAAAAIVTPAIANHSWGTYHWARTTNSFTLSVGDNVSGTWDSHLRAAATDWSRSRVLDLAVQPGRSGNVRTCKATLGRVEVCNAAYGQNQWLGIASIWANGSHITQGTVRLNDTYFNMARYNTADWRRLVVCQEVGHTFGLDHQDEDFDNANLGTCMDYTSDPSTNTQPNAHDYEQLETIYAHADTTTTVGTNFSATAPASEGGLTPAEWGRAIRFTSDGRGRVFVRELGGGQRVFTFVFWTSQRGARH
jgi:hypothetical protein